MKSLETKPCSLVVGQLYWALPQLDEYDKQKYAELIQPARFIGHESDGTPNWYWLGPMDLSVQAKWIGDPIEPPSVLMYGMSSTAR